MAPFLLLSLLLLRSSAFGQVKDSYYDCQMRQLALDYTKDVVLKPWKSR